MKLIKPSYEILEQPAGLQGIYKMIEIAGRTCYKSEDKITEDSAKKFVERIIKSGHNSVLEHGTVYLYWEREIRQLEGNPLYKYKDNKYSWYYSELVGDLAMIYVTTNYRVLIENGWLSDLQYACEPTDIHELRISVRFICDRGVSHEFVRHRKFSVSQESTRYCNYSRDKFGNELTFIQPCWYTPVDSQDVRPDEDNDNNMAIYWFERSLKESENYYLSLINRGWAPQQARAVLPNALKTELVMTGFVKDWEWFFKLRDAAPAHPQAYELAHPLHMEFLERGLL